MNKCFYASVCLLLLLLSSCDDFKYTGVYTDETTEDYELFDYYVDKYGNEGIVVDVDKSSSGKAILVISADQSYESWGLMGFSVCNADSLNTIEVNEPSFGLAMLQTMKSIGIGSFPAQAWCDKKNNNEKYSHAGSWRLPTYYEWRSLFGLYGYEGLLVKYINSALLSIGGQPLLEDEFYWTCVEDLDNYAKIKDEISSYDKDNRAIIVSPMFTTTAYKDRWMKKNQYYVRAVKYIYYSNE